MGLLFYPRGGSAGVVRYLSAALEDAGCEVSLMCGSLGEPGARTHAATYFDGIPVTAADYSPAVRAFEAGRDPIAEPVPMHPSYEDRPGVPDRVFPSVSPALGDHLTAFWERFAGQAWDGDPGALHLHHLTPIHDAVRRRWPDRPIVTHLHGTELAMLDQIGQRNTVDDAPGDTETPAGAEAPGDAWQFGPHWAARMRAAAQGSAALIAISEHVRDDAVRLLGVDPARIEVIHNGVDTDRFDRRPLGPRARLERWRRWLVSEPRGWDESGVPGSIRHTEADLREFTAPGGEAAPVLLFVGRFLGMKRVPLLIRAYARARPRFRTPAPLVIWGGFPGEWEGEHPHAVAVRERAEGVRFVGWRGHDDLPEGLACSDVMVAPSTNEPFGQVYLEAMACGLPVLATRSGGPLSFINTRPERPSGWLVEPDDEAALADALVEAVNDQGARRERGANAYEQIRTEYSWRSLAGRFTALYESVGGYP
jgi:glycosyltransferase involved in cell wall biosynthesis